MRKHYRPIPCERCNAPLTHPHWRRADYDEYRALCPTCEHDSDLSFTPLGAIQQANAICAIAKCINYPPARYESAVQR